MSIVLNCKIGKSCKKQLKYLWQLLMLGKDKDPLDPTQLAKLERAERTKCRHQNKQILEHLIANIVTNPIFNSTPSLKDHLHLASPEQTKHHTSPELKKEVDQEEEAHEKIAYAESNVNTVVVNYLPTIYGNLWNTTKESSSNEQ